MKANSQIEEDIIYIENNTLYKISLYLLSGNGIISLNKIGNHDYILDYVYQPEIILFINLPDFSICSNNTGTDSNFTFFINSTKVDNKIIQLDNQKNYKIKYFLDEDKDDIFPLNIKL